MLTSSTLQIIADLFHLLQKRHCNAREQATSDYFGSTEPNTIILWRHLHPPTLQVIMKPIPKDEECTHSTSTNSRGECNLFEKYIVAVHVQ